MLSSLSALDSSLKLPENTNHGASRVITWSTLPELRQLKGYTLFGVGRRFFVYSPDTILKLDTDEGEAVMIKLAYDLLGPVVPRLDAFVSISGPSAKGILITRQPGKPLVELWPTLCPEKRRVVKTRLAALLVRMRAPRERFNYYGRPGAQPYITLSQSGPNNAHDFCRNRAEWDASRVRALYSAAADIDMSEDRIRVLEHVQYESGASGATLVDSPVLTHGDLSDRNILVDPSTLEITGLIDWELANVAPAYFEYAVARLSGGHQTEWRKVLLEVLREVLHIECEHEVAQSYDAARSRPNKKQSEDLFREALATWNALVDVERAAQGYSDDCY